jgi:hypothetical protein
LLENSPARGYSKLGLGQLELSIVKKVAAVRAAITFQVPNQGILRVAENHGDED